MFSLGIVCQSPRFTFTPVLNSTLSYDPTQNITSGFLSYRWDETNSSHLASLNLLDLLLSDVKTVALHASHPMLLPLLFLRRWCYVLQDHYTDLGRNLKAIQRDTGQMKNFFREIMNEENLPQFVDFNEIHTRVVEQHTYAATIMTEFVEQMSINSLHALDEVREEWLENSQITMKLHHHETLRKFAQQLQHLLKAELQFKHRALGWLDIQLKVVRTFLFIAIFSTLPCLDLRLPLYC